MLIREAELSFESGLNAVTGGTGRGRAIFAQAIGLLLGTKADASSVGADAAEAYVEAELDVPDGFFHERRAGLARRDASRRRVGSRGRAPGVRRRADSRLCVGSRGRARGRRRRGRAPDRDVRPVRAAAARAPAFQLDVLDAFCGDEQLERRREAATAWRELGAARRRHDELTRDAGAAAARLAELEALVEGTEGLGAGDKESLAHPARAPSPCHRARGGSRRGGDRDRTRRR